MGNILSHQANVRKCNLRATTPQKTIPSAYIC